MLNSAAESDEFKIIEKHQAPLTVSYNALLAQKTNEPITKAKWNRANVNYLWNALDTKFIIDFISNNHFIYKYIRLELLYSNTQYIVKLEFGLQKNTIDFVSQINSIIPVMRAISGVTKVDIKNWDNAYYKAPTTLEISVLSPESGNNRTELFELFKIVNEVADSMLNPEAFFEGASDIAYTLIPMHKRYTTHTGIDISVIQNYLSNGLIDESKSRKNHPK